MLTIEQQETVLETVLAAVSGVKKVFTEYPDALQDRELPALILFPADGSYDQVADGANSLTVDRVWRALLYVKRAELGREFQAQCEVKPFLTAIPLALAARQVLNADGYGFQVFLDRGGDTGPRPLTYNDQAYAGAEFRFRTVIDDEVDQIGTI